MTRTIVSKTAGEGVGADTGADMFNTVIVLRTLYAFYLIRKLEFELAEN
jgi:hypothetical protein